MTVRAAFANGNLTSASTWEAIDATSYLNSESGNTAVTTSYQLSASFTPGAITIDGFAVKIASRNASPTGTITFELYNLTGTVLVASVTVNVSDLPTCTATSGTTTPVYTAEGGWFFVNIGTTVLLAATNYEIGVKTSSSSQVNLWTNGTPANWSRYLRSETTGAPAAGDDLIITGEWTAAATVTARTVTMDSTAATNYGSNTTSQVTPSLSICNNGTLTWGTSASTNYILQQSGHIIVFNGGTYSQGTSGTPVPSGSTAVLQFNCTASGDFGLVRRNGGTVNMNGVPRTAGKLVTQCHLNANAAAAATSVTLDTDTGWLSGDLLCFAPTDQTSTHYESKAATGNATTTTIAVTALTNAHSGTSPTQGEVGNLTRNVSMIAVTSAAYTFYVTGLSGTDNVQWTEFRYLSANLTGKYGILINNQSGTTSFNYCSVHDCGAGAVVTSVNSSWTFSNSVFYNTNIATTTNGMFNVTGGTGTWTCSGNMFCGGATASTSSSAVSLAGVAGTFTNNSISGWPCSLYTGAAMIINANAAIGTISNINIHSNNQAGLILSASQLSGVLSAFTIWRHAAYGMVYNANMENPSLTFQTFNIFGNTTDGIFIPNNGGFIMDTCTINGDTTFATANAIMFNSGGFAQIFMYSCQLSIVSGIYTACAVDFLYNSLCGGQGIIADNCIFNGTARFNGIQQCMLGFPLLQAQNFGQVANDNRTYVANFTLALPGIIQTSSSTYRTSAPSCQLTPNSAAVKLASGMFYVPCNSGATATFSVYVNVGATYNGNAPRLILARQDSMGVTSQTVCATWSGSTGTWVKLTYTTSTAPQNGVYAFYVDCDGTAGSIYLDDATPS